MNIALLNVRIEIQKNAVSTVIRRRAMPADKRGTENTVIATPVERREKCRVSMDEALAMT